MISILSLCDNAEVLSVFRLIKIILSATRIIVPVLLILSLSIEFMQATASSNADLLKKASSNAVRKAIAAILVFFIPTFLAMVVNLTSGDETYKTCLESATSENISAAYTRRAENYMELARGNLSYSAYIEATIAIRKISDDGLKSEYQKELNDIKKALDVQKLVNIVRLTKSQADYQKAAAAVEELEDEELKEKLTKELEEIAATMTSYLAEYSSGSEYITNTLGLPRYDQCDPRWGNINYDTGGATLCSSSCGYTSFAMIAAGLNHDMSITPPTVVSKIRKINLSAGQKTSRGYGAASTSELLNYASQFGMTSQAISANSQSIQQALNSGKAVIALVPGHYIVFAPSGQSNTAVLLDPFSNWADSRKRSGTNTLDSIFAVYGAPSWAAAYSK